MDVQDPKYRRDNKFNRSRIETLQRRLAYLQSLPPGEIDRGFVGAEISALAWAIKICQYVIDRAK
jgi:hypothetical protein